MSRSFMSTAIQSVNATTQAIAAVAAMLMRTQSRSEDYAAPTIDARQLSEHMQRDLGLVDGRVPHARSHAPGAERHDPGKCWTDHVQTPHAA